MRINVVTASASYQVWLEPTLGALAPAFADLHGRQVLVVADATVQALHGSALGAYLPHAPCVAVPAGDEHKNLTVLSRVWDALAEASLRRDGLILAFGGGMVGDLSGLAAALYMRGIEVWQLPTTLLAMVDSSVGGKTAINHPLAKNLIGAFHQPGRVLIALDWLKTLPEREFRAGLAEVIKIAAIRDDDYFGWLELERPAILARDPAALAPMVSRAIAHKAAIVAIDERESGPRALLNFGHTFGHALEALGGYQSLLHGEAVAIGMARAARLSAALGLASSSAAQRLIGLIAAYGLPTADAAQHPVEAQLAVIGRDKKAMQDGLRFVLWHGIGTAAVHRVEAGPLLAAALADGPRQA